MDTMSCSIRTLLSFTLSCDWNAREYLFKQDLFIIQKICRMACLPEMPCANQEVRTASHVTLSVEDRGRGTPRYALDGTSLALQLNLLIFPITVIVTHLCAV